MYNGKSCSKHKIGRLAALKKIAKFLSYLFALGLSEFMSPASIRESLGPV